METPESPAQQWPGRAIHYSLPVLASRNLKRKRNQPAVSQFGYPLPTTLEKYQDNAWATGRNAERGHRKGEGENGKGGKKRGGVHGQQMIYRPCLKLALHSQWFFCFCCDFPLSLLRCHFVTVTSVALLLPLPGRSPRLLTCTLVKAP